MFKYMGFFFGSILWYIMSECPFEHIFIQHLYITDVGDIFCVLLFDKTILIASAVQQKLIDMWKEY
jgi:hypothetical protein